MCYKMQWWITSYSSLLCCQGFSLETPVGRVLLAAPAAEKQPMRPVRRGRMADLQHRLVAHD